MELSAREAARRLKAAAQPGGNLLILSHAQKEMVADGFNLNDVLSAIREGRVTRAEPNPRGRYRYTIEGPPVDRHSGLNVAIVFELKTESRAVVVTCFKVRAATMRRRPRPRGSEKDARK